MFPWMLDMAAPLPLPRATGQMRAPARGAGGGARRAAEGFFPLTSAALPNDNAAPGVMTPRAALLLDLVLPSVLHRLTPRKAEDAEETACLPITGLRECAQPSPL